MRPRTLLPVLCGGLVAGALSAGPRVQSPSAPWKTVTTAHYRIHFPADPSFADFAREVTSRIEGIHAAVTEAVGYETKVPVDVLLRDPVLEANGMAVPLLRRPFLELWRTPPEPDSAIGHFHSWEELLVGHELVHMHHLMRPQNKPNLWDQLYEMPVGPLARKSPRWLTEGYATLLEGKLTGSGRPHSVYRAAVIRQWALQGKLPTYEAVSGMGGFRGGSMAYLIGSAYLEWLEARNPQDPDILKKLWKQLASKKRRDFDASFRATFGLSAKDGYERWSAEVTHDALALERRLKAGKLLREGEVFARLDGEVTDLALSPDGTKLLARVIAPKAPGLRIWDLAAPAAESKGAENAQQAPDPEEVEDRAPEFKAVQPRWTVRRRDGAVPRRAWWSGPAQVTYELRYPDAEGVLRPQLRTLDLVRGEARWGGDPRPSSVPSPYRRAELDGTWNLVKVLPDGSQQRLTRTLSAAWQPTATLDGKTLYYVQLTATGCEIRRLDLTQAPLEDTPLPVDPLPLVPGAILSAADAPSKMPGPATAPPATDYRARDTHQMSLRSAYVVTPAASSFQLGLGGTDLLGRLDWHALGSMGEARGPRGGVAGIAYRGWAWAPSLEAFTSLEKPSRQHYVPVEGLDRERRGAELAFFYEERGRMPFMVRPVLAWERVTPVEDGGGAVDRTLGGGEAGLSVSRSRGEAWSFTLSGKVRGAAGRTDQASWSLAQVDLGLRMKTPAGPVVLKAQEGRLGGDPTSLDRFALGGTFTSVVPESLEWNRVAQAALPAYLQTGDRMRSLRGELGAEVRAYVEHAVAWDAGVDRPAAQRVIGVEADLTPLLAGREARLMLGRIRAFVLGVHRPLDGAMKDRTIATVMLVLRP